MIFKSRLLAFSTAACLTLAATASATLIESWENSGLSDENGAGGTWDLMDASSTDVTVAYSELHATEGKYSLKITTSGG